MLECEFCGTVNGDGTEHCSSCGQPLTAEAARSDLHTTEVQLHARKVRREIILGVGGVLLVGGLVFAGIREARHSGMQKEVKTFYTSFREVDDATVAPFWQCITRSSKAPKDNIELATTLDAAIVKSGGGYSKHARTKCLPMLQEAPSRYSDLTYPSVMSDAYSEYLNSVRALGKDAVAYVDSVDALEKETARDETLKREASNFHYAGKESVETYAYDRFLRCAAPGYAQMKGMQDLLEYLSTVLKDPVTHVTRWRKECYPMVEKTDGTKPDPDYKAKVASFSSDDRDIEAFQDVLKASNDKQRRALHAPFEKAWYQFAQARDALAAQFKDYLH
jgi:hypothetical protein